jgi:alpha 1,3-glucosidase
MMGFYFESSHIYGLPERKNKLTLNDTRHGQPYRLFAVDKFPHNEWDNMNLYSGIPYITGHSNSQMGNHDESILWMSASETFVDIFEDKNGGKMTNFMSEGGVLEFFMIGASTPKRIHKRLATITGFQALPPLFSLGFHYSRWEDTSAQKVRQYNEKFE